MESRMTVSEWRFGAKWKFYPPHTSAGCVIFNTDTEVSSLLRGEGIAFRGAASVNILQQERLSLLNRC